MFPRRPASHRRPWMMFNRSTLSSLLRRSATNSPWLRIGLIMETGIAAAGAAPTELAAGRVENAKPGARNGGVRIVIVVVEVVRIGLAGGGSAGGREYHSWGG